MRVRASLALLPPLLVAALVVLGVALVRAAVAPPVGRSEAVPGRRDFVLPDVTVVNPGLGRREHASVHVRDSRVVSLAARPSGATRVLEAFRGAFVMPGLIDMHAHYWSEQPELFGLMLLAHGVTTVRDAGDTETAIFDTRERIEAGELVGPRIFTCGPILEGDPPTWPGAPAIEDPAAAREVVREIAALGADCVKVYDGLPRRVLEAVRRVARREGLPVIGHVPEGVRLEESGLSDVQHLSGVAGTARAGSPEEGRVRELARAWQALSPERLRDVARLSRARRIAHTPTLVFWQRFFRLFEPRDPEDPPWDVVPSYHRLLFWKPERPWSRTEADRRDLSRTLDRMKDAVRVLHDAGVTVHAGSDALNPFLLPGGGLHDELHLLAEAGLSPEEALESATREAAETLGEIGLGAVRRGSEADLLVFREDPTRDLGALDGLEAVITRGKLHRVEQLRARLAAERRRFESPLYRTVWTSVARLQQLLGLSERRL